MFLHVENAKKSLGPKLGPILYIFPVDPLGLPFR